MNTVILDNLDHNKKTAVIPLKPRRIVRFVFMGILFILLVLGFIGISMIYFQEYQNTGSSKIFSAADFDETPTPTPFQPIDPTPTYIPAVFPTDEPDENQRNKEDKDEEKEEPKKEEIKPVETVVKKDDLINIMVLGSDQRPYDGGFRTDTIILVSINSSDKTISMVSFPRDLYVYVPGWSYQRINSAMLYGGFDLLAQTLEYNFGVKPSSYVMVNFDVFITLIDKLGGVDVEVESNFRDVYLDGNYKRFPVGIAHMNGETALWYARSRQTSNDLDRARRQQEVLQAVINRIIKSDVIENAKTLYDLFIDNVNTNLKWKEIASIIPLSVHLKDSSQIKRYIIGNGVVYDWITPGGAMVLVPIQDKVNNLLNEALGNK